MFKERASVYAAWTSRLSEEVRQLKALMGGPNAFDVRVSTTDLERKFVIMDAEKLRKVEQAEWLHWMDSE
jgi:hypothetical protein